MFDYSKITPEMVQSGDVYIEVYPMMSDNEGDRLANKGETPEFYDVWLRPDDWDTSDGTAYAEFENLSFIAANERVEELVGMFPGIVVNWIEV